MPWLINHFTTLCRAVALVLRKPMHCKNSFLSASVPLRCNFFGVFIRFCPSALCFSPVVMDMSMKIY